MVKISLIDPRNNKKLSKKDLTRFKKFSNILDLYISEKSDLSNIQSDFYNDVKFPNYDDIEDFGSLIDKANKSIFAKMLDDEIPMGANLLEAGCGTGQLSIFLSRYNRNIHAIDISKGSLIEAKNFVTSNSIKNITFYRMNIFNLFFLENTFDVIISNGVLHHTHNAELAFTKLCNSFGPGGLADLGDVRGQLVRVALLPPEDRRVRLERNETSRSRICWHIQTSSNVGNILSQTLATDI